MNYSSNFFRYIKENFIISLKEQLEYKSSFYGNFFASIFENVTFLLFGIIILESFEDIITWSIADFAFFILALNLFKHFAGFFRYSKALAYYLPSGDLNVLLKFPGNRFLLFFGKINQNPLIFIFADILILLPFILYFGNYSIFNLGIALFVILFFSIIDLLFINFLDSFSWYFLKLGSFLRYDIYYRTINLELFTYPAQFFKGSKPIYLILSAFPYFYISMIVVPIVNGSEVFYFKEQILIFLFATFIFILGIFINWKIGLKKYEAFG